MWDMMQDTVLENIRVIDLTHYVAGPYATKLMAGFGAEVIKVEKPGTGDGLRSLGPYFRGKADLETSIPFLWLNTGKKSVTLNLKDARGRDMFFEMVRQADLVVENFSPLVMEKLGLSYEILHSLNPRLIMVSISNYGSAGPRRDYAATEMEMQAASGIMSLTGDRDKPPLASGPLICQYSAGQHAYLAAAMALFHREKTGAGQQIEISIQECSMENIEISLTRFLHTRQCSTRGAHMMVPWDTYTCQDGSVTVIAMPYRHWQRAKELFREPALYQEKFATLRGRITHREEYEELLKPCIKDFEKYELFLLGQEQGLAFGYVAGPGEAIDSPQHEARGFFQDIDHPCVGKHRIATEPYHSAQTVWKLEPAPLLGESNAAVYKGTLGYTDATMEQLAAWGVI